MKLSNSMDLRKRLTKQLGITQTALDAAWPDWWTDDAEASVSAKAELRFSLARKLGLDPQSILDDDEPQWFWNDSAKFKNFSGDIHRDQPALNSFGSSIARLLLTATPAFVSLQGIDAVQLRNAILARSNSVQLLDLISLSWSVGIPVIHLRIYPITTKRMSAMAVNVAGRYAILLARESSQPSISAFHLAHEIGHIVLGHLGKNGTIIDMEPDDALFNADSVDNEEKEADAFALALLTGIPDVQVVPYAQRFTAATVARDAISVGRDRGIDPGVLALCLGYSTGKWDVAQKALKLIYPEAGLVWKEINKVADTQLNWEALSEDSIGYLKAVLGAEADAAYRDGGQ